MASGKYPQSDRPALPEYLARKGQGKMKRAEVRSVVQGALTECANFVDNELSFERARATEYYLGKPFGNEEDGRSQAILTEVRDAVDAMLPSLMRVFFGPEHAVEFRPTRADTVEQAAQKTDYVRYVFEEENQGFLKTMQVLKDGLIRKIGIFKYHWDDAEEVEAFRQEGIDAQQLQMLYDTEGVEVTSVEPVESADPNAPPLYDVDCTRLIRSGRVVVDALPPEEFIFNRQARSLETALILAHRTDKTRGELLAMGVKEKDIDDHAGAGSGSTDVSLQSNAEEIARRDVAGIGRVVGYGFTNDPEMGPENAKILYTEALMRLDEDGDGIAEWRRICCIGPAYYPVVDEPADPSVGFALFTPYPEPHTLIGGSLADRTMDAQKINSSILRAMLDSLAASIFPRYVFTENQVSIPDIMNTAIGAPIRERVPNSVRALDLPFVGKEAMPVLGFMQEVIQRRTGRRVGDAGLDADALQSTGKDAVQAVLGTSQESIEIVARVFAEMTLKPLFDGIGKLLQLKQPRAEVIRLRGQWVEVDPRTWTAGMDATVNVALGTTYSEKKVQTLMAVIQDQTQLLAQLGPDNPMVSLPMLRNAKARILRLQGIQNVDDYYKPIPANWQPPPPPPPQPTPEQAAMQSEQAMAQQRTVKELAIKQDELALEQAKFTFQQQFQLRELETNAELKRLAINAQFQASTTSDQLSADVQKDLGEAELTIKAHQLMAGQQQDRPQVPPSPPMGDPEQQAVGSALASGFGGVRQRQGAPA